MKKKLGKKLTLTRQTVSNLNKKEMNGAYGGIETVAGPQCDTMARPCSMDCTFTMAPIRCDVTSLFVYC